MMKNTNWFEIDKKGLAQILARKGKEFAIFELLQNAWDEAGVTEADVALAPVGSGWVRLIVRDNSPNGFSHLTDAYTLFAPSKKKNNPEQRGRFNLGEKLVLALSREASVATTTGTVHFNDQGRRRSNQTVAGSEIKAVFRMTIDEIAQAACACLRLIPPSNIRTTINGVPIAKPVAKYTFEASLLTEISNLDGELIKATRKTVIDVYDADHDHPAAIYEMGIPVCSIEGKYCFNVMQKVPLTLDREEVLPQFKKQLSVATLNAMADIMDTQDVNTGWATEAVTSPDAKPEALESYMTKRFGEKRVAYDPSDPEANKLAVSKGYTVVTGSMLSGAAWNNVKQHDIILPAGQVTPSPRVWTGEDDPNSPIFKDWIPEKDWTKGMKQIADFARHMAQTVLRRTITVKFCATAHHLGAASYGPAGNLVFNKFRMGAKWFEQGITKDVVSLLIHEFGHNTSLDHLSENYHEALCQIGAEMYFNGELLKLAAS
jgi:hypothetical protein